MCRLHRASRLVTTIAMVACCVRPTLATTTTYPYTDPNPPFEQVTNWDATAGIAGGDTVILQNNSTYSSSVNPITNSGTLQLNAGTSFNNAYEFSLGMTGTGGVLISGGFASLTGTNSYTGGTVIDGNSGGSLIATTSSLNGFVDNTSVLRFQQDFNGTFSGTLIGGGQLQRYGTGTVTLSGSVATPSQIFNSEFGGRLVGTTNTIKGPVINYIANLEFNQDFDGTFQGDFGQSIFGNVGDTGNVYKTGTGALTLTGNNRFSIANQSNLFIQGGRVQGPAESVDFNGTITVSSGAELRLIQGNEVSTSLQANITGAGIVRKTGTGTVDVQGTNDYTGGTIVEAGQLLFNAQSLPLNSGTYGNFQLTGSGSGNSTGITVSIGGSGADVEFNGLISGSGSLTVTQYGAGLELTAANTYTGGSFINAGRLVGSTQTMPGPITFLNAPELASEVVFKQALNGTAAYPITGNGGIYKTGAGTLTLSSTASTVAGVMFVQGGKVLINGAMPNVSEVRVQSGSVLGGSGSVGTGSIGAGVVITDGTLAPGNSAGILTTSNLELGGAQTAIQWELMANTASGTARGTSYDGINLTAGGLTIGAGSALGLVFNGAGSSVNWYHGMWDSNQSWLLIDGVTSIGGTGLSDPIFASIVASLDAAGNNIATLRPGAEFTTSYNSSSGDILINYAAAAIVPEPPATVAALVGLSGALAAAMRRRKGARRS